MSPRLLILTVLDPLSRTGLGPDTQAVNALGVEVVPISTGTVTWAANGSASIAPTRARRLRGALETAFEDHIDGMLVGLVPGYWQTRALGAVLREALPETLVYAPLGVSFDARSHVGDANRKAQLQCILPEATVSLLPAASAAAWLGESSESSATELAQSAVRRGSHAAWLLGEPEHGRSVDVLATPGKDGVIDYPCVERSDARAPAPLAALLAQGRSLREAVESAHRHATGIGSAPRIVAKR